MIIKNYVNNDATEKMHDAIAWERCDMQCQLVDRELEKLQKTIDSDDAEPEAIALAKVKKAKAEKRRAEVVAEKTGYDAIHAEVVSTIAGASNEHTSNDETAVRNYLRLSACDESGDFFSVAILTEVKFAGLYDALTAIHDKDSDEIDETGIRVYSSDIHDLSKKTAEKLQSIIKSMFSIPIENDITKKINCKLSKSDLNAVHETFVTGMKVDIAHTKKGGTEVNGLQFNYAIKQKKNKKTGDITYEGTRFKSNLAKLAFNRIFG